MEISEGTVAYPDIHALATAGAKISGFVLPDGASTSKINWKVIVPNNLNATPASSILIFYMTKAAVAGTPTIHMTLSRSFLNNSENMDVAFTAETAKDIDVSTSIETLTIDDYDLSAEPTAEEIILGQLERDPTHANDDFTGDIMVVAMYLKITVDT